LEAELLDEVVDRILESLVEVCLDAHFPGTITRVRELAIYHGSYPWRHIPVGLSILLVTPKPEPFDRMLERELFEELLRDCVRFHGKEKQKDVLTAIIVGDHLHRISRPDGEASMTDG
jgi:integrase